MRIRIERPGRPCPRTRRLGLKEGPWALDRNWHCPVGWRYTWREDSMDVTLPAQVRRRTSSFVDEYAGAVAPGRVVAVAAVSARHLLRRGTVEPGFFAQWEDRVRRRLILEVCAPTDSSRATPAGTADPLRAAGRGAPPTP